MISIAAEKNFENKIKQYLKENNCWFVKFFANAYTKVGIPDILVCVNGRFVGIEVKATRGVPSELQKYNINEINKSEGFGVIVRPDQFENLCYMIQCLIYSDVHQAREICNEINTLWGI